MRSRAGREVWSGENFFSMGPLCPQSVKNELLTNASDKTNKQKQSERQKQNLYLYY
jgi:hypothetical protein